jgi:O-antigen/teichoic acid export membrane protein
MIKKIIEHKNFLIYGFGQIINLITPLLVSPLIISKCGIENFGKIAVATSIFLIISLVIDFGSNLIGVKEISVHKDNKNQIKNYLNTVYTLKILIFFIVLFSIIVAVFLLRNKIDYKLYLLSLPILLAQVFNPLWIYQGKEDFKTSNIIIFFSKGIYIISIFLMIKKSDDYLYVIPLLGISNSLTYLYYFIKIYKDNNLLFFRVGYKSLKNEFLNTFSILLSNIFISVYTNAPIIIVKYILGDFAAGIYKIGDMLLTIYRNYLSVFFNVSFPKFCSLFSQSQQNGYNYLKKMNILNIILLLFSISIILIGSFIYTCNFTTNYKLNETILFCRKFLFIPIITALNIPFYQFLIYKNQQKIISKIIFISTCIMLLMCYSLTSIFNITGTLISIYVSEALTTSLIIFFYLRKKLLI